MAIASLLVLLALSLLLTALLVRKYLSVTRKRRELIAALGGSGRAVPRFKHLLMSTYVISTLVWSVVLLTIFIFIQ